MFLSTHYTHDRCTVHVKLNIMLPIYRLNGYDTTSSAGYMIFKMERSDNSNSNGGAGSWDMLDPRLTNTTHSGVIGNEKSLPYSPLDGLGLSEDCSDTVCVSFQNHILYG